MPEQSSQQPNEHEVLWGEVFGQGSTKTADADGSHRPTCTAAPDCSQQIPSKLLRLVVTRCALTAGRGMQGQPAAGSEPTHSVSQRAQECCTLRVSSAPLLQPQVTGYNAAHPWVAASTSGCPGFPSLVQILMFCLQSCWRPADGCGIGHCRRQSTCTCGPCPPALLN